MGVPCLRGSLRQPYATLRPCSQNRQLPCLRGSLRQAYATLRPCIEIGNAAPCLREAYAKLTRPYAHAAKKGSCHAYAEAYAKLTQPYAHAVEIGNALPSLREAYAKLTRPYARAVEMHQMQATGRDLDHPPARETELTPELTRSLRERYAPERACPRRF